MEGYSLDESIFKNTFDYAIYMFNNLKTQHQTPIEMRSDHQIKS